MVQPITNIPAEFDVVIADDVRPVVYKLELARVLQELVGRRAVQKVPAAVGSIARIVDVELRQTSIQCQIADICIWDAELVAQWLVEIGAQFIEVDPVVTEAKISEPAGRKNVVAARRKALVPR